MIAKALVYLTGFGTLGLIAHFGPQNGLYPGMAASFVLLWMAVAEFAAAADKLLNPPRK